jgi:RNA polymerase sigma-70 factor (ECF subfamily)
LTNSIEHIIAGCIEGKSTCQEALYRLYSGKMWALCLRYARDRDEAKDILQEGFMKIFERISQYEGRGHFEGWMRRVFINLALGEYRKQRTLRIDAVINNENEQETYANIECELSAAELLEVIQELPPQYKLVFNLYAIEGYSHKEIGGMLGISEGTSKSNLSRARDILQRKVNLINEAKLKIG